MMIPFLILLPDTRLGNHRKKGEAEKSLSFVQAFQQLVKSRRFCLFNNKHLFIGSVIVPVGSFLSLIIAERGGDAGDWLEMFVECGAAVEFLSLLC